MKSPVSDFNNKNSDKVKSMFRLRKLIPNSTDFSIQLKLIHIKSDF